MIKMEVDDDDDDKNGEASGCRSLIDLPVKKEEDVDDNDDEGEHLDFCCRGSLSPVESRATMDEGLSEMDSDSIISRRRGRAIRGLKLR